MTAYLLAGLGASSSLAFLFFWLWTVERERRRADKKLIRALRAMVDSGDLLRDNPDAVSRVFDAFEARSDDAVPGAPGDQPADGGGAGGA